MVVDEWGLWGLLVVGVGWDECWFGGLCGVLDHYMWNDPERNAEMHVK